MPIIEKKELIQESVNIVKPEKVCWNCYTDSWVQVKGGRWLCQICHPVPKEE